MAKKAVIAITSVLKPVDDTRNYEKIGFSLDKTGKYDIYVFGQYVSNTPAITRNTYFQPIFNFRRLSLKRLLAPWKIYINLIKVKPDLIIVNTHELLTVTVLYKIIFGSKIIYDVQENYHLNICSTSAFPKGIRTFIAGYVRLKEKLFAQFIDHFLLAEKCYEWELPFIKSNHNILENKYLNHSVPQSIKKQNHDKISFIYTGTIAEAYGIFDAIALIEKLNANIDLSFTIIGYCPNYPTLRKIQKTISDKHYIKIIGGDTLVPHNQILKAIYSADYALLPYRLNNYYAQRIPTNIYECLALKTPMVLRRNPHWKSIFTQIDAFVFSDFKNINEDLIYQLKHGQFFQEKNKIEPFWNFESEKLIAIVNKVLYNI